MGRKKNSPKKNNVLETVIAAIIGIIIVVSFTAFLLWYVLDQEANYNQIDEPAQAEQYEHQVPTNNIQLKYQMEPITISAPIPSDNEIEEDLETEYIESETYLDPAGPDEEELEEFDEEPQELTPEDHVALPVEGCTEYPGYFTEYMDLLNRETISEAQMDQLIEYWTRYYPNSEFKGTASAFIDAANDTGYDPIFLLCLAGYESGWDVSNLHARKCNPYSINMVDSNPNKGYTLGETFSEGIYNGGVWIYDHYYCEGQENLHSMIHGKKRYASSDEWIKSVVWLMEKSYAILHEKE